MFICDNCGAVFAEPTEWREDGEAWSGSPCCLDSYAKAQECDHCGNFFEENGYSECESCLRSALEKFRTFLDESFTEAELYFLDDCIDGNGVSAPKRLRYPL